MKPKFKENQKVRISNNIVRSQFQPKFKETGFFITKEMEKLKGQVVTIKHVRNDTGNALYRINELPLVTWVEEWLDDPYILLEDELFNIS